VLRVAGTFTQAGATQSFAAGGTHTTILNGTSQQTVSFANPAAGSSRFFNLQLENPAGVSFTTSAAANGTVTLAAASGTITSGAVTVTIGDDLVDAAGGRWQVTNTAFSGATPSLPATLASNVSFTGVASLPNGFSVTGDLSVPSGTLTLNGQTVTVSGGLNVITLGILTMNNAADQLTVAGGATFSSGNFSTGLTAGVLRVAGTFTQAGATQSFAAGGTHTTILNGTSQQTVSFANPAASSSRFFNLEIANAAGVVFSSNAAVTGSVTVTNGTVTGPAANVTIAGNLTDAAGNRWQPLTTTFTGNPTLPTALTTNAVFTGSASLTAGFTLTGDLSVTANSLNLKGQTVTVSGGLTVGGTGMLVMGPEVGTLAVAGDVTINSTTGNSSLSAGTLQVSGNFTQTAGSNSNFNASGTHLVRCTGAGTQTLSFGSPGSAASQSHFQNLEVANTGAGSVNLTTNAFVNGAFTLTSGALTGAGATLTVAGAATKVADASLTLNGLSVGGALGVEPPGPYAVNTTTFTGSGPQTIPSATYTNVTITGTASFGASTALTGNLAVSGTASNVIIPLGVTVDVGANFSTGGTGFLTIGTGALLRVAGNATFAGGNTSATITGGRIEVSGNFTQSTSATAFAPSGGTVALQGAAAKTVSFANPGTTSVLSHFFNLELISGGGDLTLAGAGNVYVNGTLTANPATAPVTVKGAGFGLTANTMNVAGLTLDRVLFRFFPLSGGPVPVFNNVVFQNYLDNDLIFNIQHPGMTTTFNNLTFQTFTTGTGVYVRAQDTTAGDASLILTITHPAGNPSNGQARTALLGGASVTWVP
jgi:hypothetical protein